MAEEELFEALVRELRNALYGHGPIYGTEEGWSSVRANWMNPENVAWIQEQVRKCLESGFIEDLDHFQKV